jgi:hypothetical protein
MRPDGQIGAGGARADPFSSRDRIPVLDTAQVLLPRQKPALPGEAITPVTRVDSFCRVWAVCARRLSMN